MLAGPAYLGVGLALALTRDGFDLAEHQLSLLMLGEHGWAQRANLLVGGVLVLVVAAGSRRAMTGQRTTSLLVGGFGVGLLGSGVFAPDPMAGFPAAAPEQVTTAGILHLVFGLVTFGCLAAACFTAARWAAARGDRRWARRSRAAGAVVVLGFAGGAALSQLTVGVALLWLAVVTSYGWLAATSVALWRTVPHPDAHRR